MSDVYLVSKTGVSLRGGREIPWDVFTTELCANRGPFNTAEIVCTRLSDALKDGAVRGDVGRLRDALNKARPMLAHNEHH